MIGLKKLIHPQNLGFWGYDPLNGERQQRDPKQAHHCAETRHVTHDSRVCAVAQYAVLEANAKVDLTGQFSHPYPSETPQPISMLCQIY